MARGPAALSEPYVRQLVDVPRTAGGTVDLDRIVAALGPSDLLESAPGLGWSYVVPHGGPLLVDDGERSQLRGGSALRSSAPGRDPASRRATAANDELTLELGTDPFAALDAVCERFGIVPDSPVDPDLPPFIGGLVGAFAYDLGRRVERIPRLADADRDHPHLVARLADVVIAVPPEREHALVITHASDRVTAPDLAARHLADRLAVAAAGDPRTLEPPTTDPRPTPRPVTTSLTRDRYLAAVRTVLEHIAAGDAFQVNLTQRLTARWDDGLEALYRALRANSPAPFGAMLPSIGVASISPESFLAVDGRDVTTRPIKGTRPRDADPALDAAFADDLATATKDRAENVMIVDLERNDLGRVCVPGSVRVPRLLDVESHPTVWHLVSTVAGRLRDDVGYGGLLRATFPCGSITGAPKVAAMDIIERLEPVRRGWYCGAIGFFGPGRARLSVAIRTATLQTDGLADHGAGGGIVADSDPEAELAESLDKAAAFLRAVAATHVTTSPPVRSSARG